MGERDERDAPTWVVFELSGEGERAAANGILERHLREKLGAAVEIFIPYLAYEYQGKVSMFNVMEGYVFVTSGLDERLYLALGWDSPFLKSALHTRRERSSVLMTVHNNAVEELRDKLGEMVAVEIAEGMMVSVCRGPCKGLTGKVISLSEKFAHVLIEMRTLRTIRSIPRYALIPKGDEVGSKP